MVAAIPEAVETAEAATARGAAGEVGQDAPRHARRTRTSRAKALDEAARPQRQPRQVGGQRAQAPRQTVQQRRQERLKGGAKRAGRGALRARLPGSHSYQPVILAEFIAAVVIVATGPVVKGGTPEAQTKGSPSPYSVNTIKQLLGIGGVYFVLALLAASQRAGRLAAWFGGLVLVGLLLSELASGDLSALFKVLGPSTPTGVPAAPGTLVQLGPGFLPDASGGPPTPTGQVPQNQALTQQSVYFAQPGVATTTETTPGVSVTGP